MTLFSAKLRSAGASGAARRSRQCPGVRRAAGGPGCRSLLLPQPSAAASLGGGARPALPPARRRRPGPAAALRRGLAGRRGCRCVPGLGYGERTVREQRKDVRGWRFCWAVIPQVRH